MGPKYGERLIVPNENSFGDLVPVSRAEHRWSRERQEFQHLRSMLGRTAEQNRRLAALANRVARREWGDDPMGAWHGENR